MLRRPALVSLVLAYTVLLPPGSLAKGGIEATLDGPGLAAPIRYTWSDTGAVDRPGRSPIQHLALATGYFTAAFANASLETFDRASRALRLERPRGALGPRYTLTYTLSSPAGEDEIAQDVYPYAEPHPLTYIPPGQPANESALRTGGSWFVADQGLQRALVRAGLPPNPSVHDGDGALPWTFARRLVAIGALLALTLIVAVRTRRRTQPVR